MQTFTKTKITPLITKRIWGKSYKHNCGFDLDNLCYLTIPHYDFHGKVRIGELIVNQAISQQTLSVFQELFQLQYPIEQMRLIDDFDADDYLSMTANNSSAFNYRYIDSTTILSNHSHGLAIDINPLYNPYIKIVDGKERILPVEGSAYSDRSKEHPYYIKKGDLCYQAFIKQGFTWGGDWTDNKDYQHFEYHISNNRY